MHLRMMIIFIILIFFVFTIFFLNTLNMGQKQNTSISKITSWNGRKHWNRCIDQIIAALNQRQRSWRQPNTGFVRDQQRTDMSALTTTTQPCWSAHCCHSEHMGWRWLVFYCRQRTSCRCLSTDSRLLTYRQLDDAHLALRWRQDFWRLVC